MRRNVSAACFFVLVISLVMSSVGFASDIYMKAKHHSDAMSIMGQNQPAEDYFVESWMTADKIVMMDKKQKIVVDLKKKMATIANHEKRTIMSMPLDFSKMMSQQGGDMSKDDKAQFQKMMGNMLKMDVVVQKTNEKKKIGKWNCQKYIQKIDMGMGNMTSEIWASTDIKINEELYTQYSAAMMAQIPGAGQNMEKILSELKKIRGVHVLSTQTTKMMGQSFKSTTEIIEYKEGKAPASAFTFPSGYKKENVFQE